MKKKIFLFGLLILGVVLLILFSPAMKVQSPRFVAAPPDFKVGPYGSINYPFLLPSPFEGGLVWINTHTKKGPERHCYLYDIEQKKVLGELFNGWPIFGNRDQSKVLLEVSSRSTKQRILEGLDRMTSGKFKLAQLNREESFVVFDRTNNEFNSVGRLYQFSGAGSRWYPSPTYRYGYTRPTVNSGSDVFLCDLEKGIMTKLQLRGMACGWWNETGVLFKSELHDFAVYDVVTGQTSILLNASEIKEFFQQNQITADISRNDVWPFPMWDGQQYQFYFTDTHKRWEATNSFLAKLERPSGKLNLIAADFKFEWSDSFDPTGRYYVFSGRDAAVGEKVSAVYLRDLKTGVTRTLVEDCGVNRHSIPGLYGDGVIYSRSNMLWRIGFSETNATRVFPPPEE